MSLRIGGARLVRRAVGRLEGPIVELPAFLCPALIRSARSPYYQQRNLHSTQTSAPIKPLSVVGPPNRLPQQCSGCGALSQTVDESEPGFFDLKRKSVKLYLSGVSGTTSSEEDATFNRSLELAKENDPQFAEKFGFSFSPRREKRVKAVDSPLCERCHALKHHEIGNSIFHPSLESIQETVFESPHKYNHIYHVIDAADFPMSLIPGLYNLLHITPQRSLNRRSKTGRFYHGKKMEISFIITRSDLLAPLKVQVDHMMPYLREVLRDSLGRTAADVRLGNIRCVSAKQGWWTKELKEDIWGRGGAGWMVGKVNVGKSQLFNEVFPKGRRGKLQYGKPLVTSVPPEGTASVTFRTMGDNATSSDSPLHFAEMQSPHLKGDGSGTGAPEISRDEVESLKDMLIQSEVEVDQPGDDSLRNMESSMADEDYLGYDNLDGSSLLPPPQTETDYPAMPLVSSLPGTTASPIRIPFGNGRGELIDLPGLSRGDLELYVRPTYRPSLVMRSRIRPVQKAIKPGQSLLLGGFIRITPTTPDVIFLAYSFNPLTPHLTSTAKAIGIQSGSRVSSVENIAEEGTADKIALAGTFHLKWDVTKDRTGPMTARAAAGIRVDRLPFRVMSADILIEGVGWVELTAQIRKQPREISRSSEPRNDDRWQDVETEDIDPQWPTVEVFTPDGKFAALRRPMNAWLNFAEKPSEKKAKSRPRRSMKGMKKLTRQRARVAA